MMEKVQEAEREREKCQFVLSGIKDLFLVSASYSIYHQLLLIGEYWISKLLNSEKLTRSVLRAVI